MAPAPRKPLPYPAGTSGLDLIRMAAARPSASPAAPAPAATVVSISGALKGAALDPLPGFDGLREAELGELMPARFLLGVSGHGDVQYVFLQDTSGDKALDASASRMLEQIRFRATETPLTWGFATFHWGSTVYAQPSPATEMAR